jgi:hypothetical protein
MYGGFVMPDDDGIWVAWERCDPDMRTAMYSHIHAQRPMTEDAYISPISICTAELSHSPSP